MKTYRLTAVVLAGLLPAAACSGAGVQIQVTYSGAAPEEIERQVLVPLEVALNGIDGVAHTVAHCRFGSCTVTLYAKREQDLGAIRREARRRIGIVQPAWPPGVTPVLSLLGEPVVWLTLTGDKQSLAVLSDLAQREVRPGLATVPHVGGVEASGVQRRQPVIYLDPDRLRARGLTMADVAAALKQLAVVDSGVVKPDVKVLPLPNLRELGDVIISQKDGAVVHLRDVGMIEDAAVPVSGKASHGGQPCVALGVLSTEARRAEVVRDVLQKLPDLRSAARRLGPEDVKLEAAIVRPARPEGDRDRGPVLVVDVRFPDGTSPERRAELLRRAEQLLLMRVEVAGVLALLPDEVAGDGRLLVQLASEKDRKKSLAETEAVLNRELRKNIDTLTRMRRLDALEQPPMNQAPWTLQLAGPDLPELTRLAGELRQRLEKAGLVESGWQEPRLPVPELAVEIDRKRAADVGVTLADVMAVLQIAVGEPQVVGLGRHGEVRIVVGDGRAKAIDPDDLKRLQVRSAEGQMVPLAVLVSLHRISGAAGILRCDGQRSLLLPLGSSAGKTLDELRKAIGTIPSAPKGVRVLLWSSDPERKPEELKP
jgi:multidrug efflux pump subunit AcrB